MPTSSTTYRLISTYAAQEPWKEHHDRAILCRDVEETITWGIYLFRGLTELEAHLQALALRGAGAVPDWSEFERAYRLWVTASESMLLVAETLAAEGFPIDDLAKLHEIAEEARCQVDLWDLEPEIRPLLSAALAQAGQPPTARYGA